MLAFIDFMFVSDIGFFPHEKHRYICACIYGISFGFIALIRITNATLICAVVLSVTVELIQRKE